MFPSCSPESIGNICTSSCCAHHPKIPDFTKDKFPIERNDVSGGLCPTKGGGHNFPKRPKKKSSGKTKTARKSHSSNCFLVSGSTPHEGMNPAKPAGNFKMNPPSAFAAECNCQNEEKDRRMSAVANGEKVEETCEEFMNIVQDAVLETVEKSVNSIMDNYFSKITRKLDAVCLVVQDMKSHIWKMNAKNDIRFKCLCEFLFEHLESAKKDKKKEEDEDEDEKTKFRLRQRQSDDGQSNVCCCQHIGREQKPRRSASVQPNSRVRTSKNRCRSKTSNASSYPTSSKYEGYDVKSCCKVKSENEDARSCGKSPARRSNSQKFDKQGSKGCCCKRQVKESVSQKFDKQETKGCSCKSSVGKSNSQMFDKKETKGCSCKSPVGKSNSQMFDKKETKGCSCKSSFGKSNSQKFDKQETGGCSCKSSVGKSNSQKFGKQQARGCPSKSPVRETNSQKFNKQETKGCSCKSSVGKSNSQKFDKQETGGCSCKSSVGKSNSQKFDKQEPKGCNCKTSANNKDLGAGYLGQQNRPGAGLNKSHSHVWMPNRFLRTMELIGSWRNRHKAFKHEKFGASDPLCQNQPDVTNCPPDISVEPNCSRNANNSAPFVEVTYYSTANIEGEIRKQFGEVMSETDDDCCDNNDIRIGGGTEKCFFCGQHESISQMSFEPIAQPCCACVTSASDVSS